MATYYIILTLVFVLTLLPKEVRGVGYWSMIGLLLILAAFRSNTVDQDYMGYVQYYNNALAGIFWNVEPTFLIIAQVVNYAFGNVEWLFIIYALGGVGLMAAAIKNIDRDRLTVVMFYFPGYFLLWSMTQIRVAVAGALFLFAIPYLAEGKRLKYAALISIAVPFHYLSFLLYFLLPINSSIRSVRKYLILIPLGIAIYFTGFNVASISDYVPIELIATKLLSYEEQKQASDNIFNYLFIARVLFSTFLIFHFRRLEALSKYSGVLLKIYFVGLFLHVVFGASPLASRASELLLIVEVVLGAIASRLIRNKLASTFLVFVVTGAYLTFNLFYVKLVKPYAFGNVEWLFIIYALGGMGLMAATSIIWNLSMRKAQ